MRRVGLILSLILLFVSCEKSSFSISLETLRLNKVDDVEVLVLSLAISGEEGESYNIRVSDENNYLSWSTPLEHSDGFYRAELEITKGSTFPEGDYRYRVFGSNGTESEGTITYLKDEFSPYLEDGVLSGTMNGSGQIGDSEVRIGDSASAGDILSYEDTHFNRYSITL